MSDTVQQVPLREILTRVERFEKRNDLEEYPFAGTYSFARGIFIGETKLGSTFRLDKIQRIHQGDFVYCKIMAWEGAFGLVPAEAHNCVMSGAFVVYEIDQTRIDPDYLRFYFMIPRVWKSIGAQSTGTNVRRRSLHPNQFESSIIPLPPLAEQRRIVAKIRDLAVRIDEVRSMRRQAIEETNDLWASCARTLFQRLLQNGTQPLRSLVSICGGGTPSKTNPSFWQGDIPWIRPKDMKQKEIVKASHHITRDATLHSSAKPLKPGSVLIVVRGMILVHTVPSAVLRTVATINQDMKGLVPGENLLSEYLCTSLWALNDRLLLLVEKSTHDTRKLETDKLLDFQIPVPSIPEQRQVVTFLNELEARVNGARRFQAETLTELEDISALISDMAFVRQL